jgi:hypothetical protein
MWEVDSEELDVVRSGSAPVVRPSRSNEVDGVIRRLGPPESLELGSDERSDARLVAWFDGAVRPPGVRRVWVAGRQPDCGEAGLGG